ncbi:Murein DD-endopeptidase MepM and murein hydrolase activator NlpD, contain LysM domain [Litoreibacter ascidiaceicola]|uniref:Murein DD-endopeptidase MepM and murein hydrolase activator NlpD, contain LysM domain n=2 Tax=Litoreibacter ascidiaceicola TaxID=1486859 RepID=A0A1M4TIA4_9RHOB|nr:Murein DD-endopeptidase MepM and murein hydrolase activator NlpD, contain LysM domain [Litoreibacter ascidiaceicola]
MRSRRFSKILPMVALGFGLSACDGQIGQSIANLDLDLRGTAGGLDTSSAARQATGTRPRPDNRGVISYPNYQVAVAERGDTVSSVATRIGVNPQELASYNGLRPGDKLNKGEVLALRGTVATAPTTTGGNTQPLDITEIATTAIGRAPQSQVPQGTASKRIDGPEPIRHQVGRGETAYSISRLYNVSARSLAEWNGLGPDLEVREGQYLLIPVAKDGSPTVKAPVQEAAVVAPGAGSPTPQPPSATKPLPAEKIAPKVTPAAAPAATPAAPAAASKTAKLLAPVSGSVLRPYKKRKNEGIDISASTGTPVKAAADGEVAAITRDTDQVPILVLRHAGNLLTVYANISDITVKKGDKVTRGKTIAKVGKGSPSFLHFEVREGFESVDPAPFLK